MERKGFGKHGYKIISELTNVVSCEFDTIQKGADTHLCILRQHRLLVFGELFVLFEKNKKNKVGREYLVKFKVDTHLGKLRKNRTNTCSYTAFDHRPRRYGMVCMHEGQVFDSLNMETKGFSFLVAGKQRHV